MEITRSGAVALVALCGLAGAGGAYLATMGPTPAAATDEAYSSATPQAEPAAPSASTSPIANPARAAVAPASGSSRASVESPSRPTGRQRATVGPTPSASGASGTSQPADATEPSTAAQADPPAEAPASPSPGPETSARTREPEFEELVVEPNVVLGLQFENTVTSDTARVEDQVIARVTRDVRVGDRVAIPAGARVFGEVIEVERGGRLRERARLAVRFTSIAFSDGTRVDVSTDVVQRQGDAPSRGSAAKIGGGAIGGAIIGGILGGGKGAVIGGTAGAGAGTAAVLAGGRNDAAFTAGTPVTVRLTGPVVVQVDR